MKNKPKSEQWLSLSAAANYLNIHPTTLRRWADNEQITFMLTPGGHRRFAVTELERFVQSEKVQRRKNGVESAFAEKALVETRDGLSQSPNQAWLMQLDADSRAQYRLMGQQLMGLTLQFISQPDEDLALLQRADELGEAYGKLGRHRAMPLTDALQAAMFFRDMLIETALQLPGNTHIKPEANLRLLRRINRLLNRVHLAIAEVYDAN